MQCCSSDACAWCFLLYGLLDGGRVSRKLVLPSHQLLEDSIARACCVCDHDMYKIRQPISDIPRQL